MNVIPLTFLLCVLSDFYSIVLLLCVCVLLIPCFLTVVFILSISHVLSLWEQWFEGHLKCRFFTWSPLKLFLTLTDFYNCQGLPSFFREENGNPLWYSCLESPWTEEPGGLQSTVSRRVGHDWASNTHTHTHTHTHTSTHRVCSGPSTSVWFRNLHS